ncbi:Auxin-responsive protein SAUR36 [Gossypium australe]|uniref:Auxin-responsive protein SAUR36 n=1 Tax=Gossypium australe TaxID=47621 RepID=A0A5B6WK16_9ROSI|nr:Auxin-responsive protein SAUR36 [Gossypium australe]
MISARKLVKLARKWQKLAAIKRKRITFSNTSSMMEKGHFVVYSADEKRFMLPLEYLKNEIVMELFNLAEEEFGIPSNGHLKLPFDSTLMEYAIELIKRKAINGRCSSSLNLYQQETSQQFSSFSCPTKHSPLFKKANKMISARKLIKLARKWQKLAAIKRKRITFSNTSSMMEKGHFVVYSSDEKRFILPLEYLKNEIVIELFNLAEEEFGIPSNGHLKLPFDSTFMEYAIELIKRKASKEVEKALIMSIVTGHCSSSLNLNQQETNQQLPIWITEQTSMVSTKILIMMARKWQKLAAIGRRRITSSLVDKGHFVIYTIDQKRFVIPLAYLRNTIFVELLKMSEEEFGLPSDGPITLPCDSVAMNYFLSLLQRSLSKHLEKAVVNSVASYRYSSNTSYCHQAHTDQQSLISIHNM